jgi:hypothetical protein
MIVTMTECGGLATMKMRRKRYVPVTKTFQESASWGVLESTVYFKESR